MKNKYQEALNNVKTAPSFMGGNDRYKYVLQSSIPFMEDIDTLQELVNKETPLTPTYKNTYMEYKEHYLDKDYEMLYHCPKCDSVVCPIDRCRMCNQNLDWNKYFIIEGKTYYKRSDTNE